jgi:hypothetical protein
MIIRGHCKSKQVVSIVPFLYIADGNEGKENEKKKSQ